MSEKEGGAMVPWHLSGGDCKRGAPISRKMASALRRIANARGAPLAVYESSRSRMGREADGYASGGRSEKSDLHRGTVKALFRRGLVFVEYGPIARSVWVMITPEGCAEIGEDPSRVEFLGRWEDSENIAL